MADTGFAQIHETALMRHGEAALEQRLPQPLPPAELAALSDDRLLSAMSLRIFRAGLRYSVVDGKWPAFEEAFSGFDPRTVAAFSDERIEELLGDRRLIRHLGKLRAVRANARAMLEIAGRHGGFGAWLAAWPVTEIVDLWAEIARDFTQMGGRSAPYFLRMVGKDTFVLTSSVIKALNLFGAWQGEPRSRGDRQGVQAIFNGWAEETGRPLCQLSQILAMAVD